MAVEEKVLSEEDKEQMLKESSSNKDDVEYGKIYTVSSVKILRSDKEFFEHTEQTIPVVKKCAEKAVVEKEIMQQKIKELQKQLEQAKKKQKNSQNKNKDALRALSGRPMKEKPAKTTGAQEETQINSAEKQADNQAGNQMGVQELEKDLEFCKHSEAFIEHCGQEARNDVVKLEGIMNSGQVQNWEVIIDFVIMPLPSEREKDKDNNKDKDKEKDKDKDNENNKKNPQKSGKGKGKSLSEKDKLKNLRQGISVEESERAASEKPHEAEKQPRAPLNQNMIASKGKDGR